MCAPTIGKGIAVTRFGALLVVVVFLLAAGGMPARAQTQADIDNAERRSEQIMREQQLRQLEDRERLMRSRRAPTQIESPAVPAPSGQGEGCRDITAITLSGATRMSARRQEQIVAPYEGRCLGVTEIQALLSDITKFYIEAGYATTRAYLPAQDLTTGRLRIDIVEGKVGAVRIAPESEGRVNLGTAFPYLEGDVLNLRDIEQGLDQINRLSSNNATMDILPGDNVGESVIAVKNDPGKRWHVSISGDNHGTRTTGRRQVGASLAVDNTLGLNDLISLTERRTLAFDDKSKRARSRGAMISLPYGYVTLSGGYNWSDYNSTIITAAGTLLGLSGDNRSIYGTVDYVALRTQDSKVTLSATLTGKRARNYIGGTLLDVSSRNLTVADLSANYSTYAAGGAVSAGITYSRGLRGFSALDDAPDLPSDFPRAQFHKMSFNASYVAPFRVGPLDFSWSTALQAQKAFDVLYGSEQISIGGLYSVRGFHDDSLANDDGYYVRNDLTLRRVLGTVAGRDVLFRPYIALDAGAVTGDVTDSPDGTLVGGAVGFNLNVGGASVEFFTGKPLVTPDGMDKEDINTFLRLSLSF